VIRALALLALLAASGPRAELRAALTRLLDEDVEGSRAAIEALAAAAPDDGDAQAALGILRLYQHRYGEAADLLERAGGGQDPTGFLRIARNARALLSRHLVVESDHFVVSHPPGKDEVLVPYLLEALERQRAALVRDLGAAPAGKVRVEILESPAELARLSSLTETEIRGSGTIALCKYDKLMLVSPKALVSGYDWLDTAAHELTHQVMTARTGNAAPIWLQEGIARWSETRWRGEGGEAFSPHSAALVRRAVEAGKLVTFEQMHPSLAKLPTQELAALAYAEVLLAVELMQQRGGPGTAGRVLAYVAGGASAEEAVARSLGTTWPEFEAAWRRHLATRPLPRGGEHALRRLRFRDDPKQAGPWAEWAGLPDQASRDHARLGQLFRERGRWTPARIQYRKAIDRAGARVPILANQYAIAAVMSGQKAEAEKVLREAIDWTPDYPALRVQLARLLAERKDHAGVREQLTQANRQDPFDPEIHAGLALALEALGDPGGASRERRFAEILSARPAGHAGAPGGGGQGAGAAGQGAGAEGHGRGHP
jgi:tetratricopeptide (TPR) repeat protein